MPGCISLNKPVASSGKPSLQLVETVTLKSNEVSPSLVNLKVAAPALSTMLLVTASSCTVTKLF